MPGGTVAGPATAFQVPERIDAWLADADTEVRDAFANALVTMELAGITSRYVRPTSMLGPATRPGAVGRMRRARTPAVRRAAELVTTQILNQYAASPAVERALGFTYACVDEGQPRKVPAMEVLSYPQIHRPHTEECDVVVVGSGAGGAVAAAVLARAGLSVVVLEEGGLHTRADLGGPPVERARRLFRRAGAMHAGGSPTVTLAMGAGLGGSTLVGYGSLYRPPDDVLLRWEKQGLIELGPTALAPAFDAIEHDLNAEIVPEELIALPAQRFREAARARGLRGGVVRRGVTGCRGCGTCAAGCPSDAKGTNVGHLPEAQRHGATIYANARVEQILISEGAARGVVATLVEQRSRAPKTTLTVRARAVVLAAGAIHTPALLAANAVGNRSGVLGRNLSLHPQVHVGAFFDEDVHAWRGVTQPFALDDWLESEGAMVEVTGPVPSLDAGDLPGTGGRLQQLLEGMSRYASATVSVADPGVGRVGRRIAGEPLVTYQVRDDTARHLLRATARVAEVWLAAGARAVVTPLSRYAITTEAQARDLEGARLDPVATGLRSSAPSATARMGADPAGSVVSPSGQVHGVPGLFVADASALPSCPGVAPQLLVMALASRCASSVAASFES